MPRTVERYQNPVIGDEIRLRLFAYNSNNRADVSDVEKVETYIRVVETEENPDGLTLVSTLTDITHDETGLYSVSFTADSVNYKIGNYIDLWYVTVDGEDVKITNHFAVHPKLWFTSPLPLIYDFKFGMSPNRVRKGSKRYLNINVTPNVPNSDTLYQYYSNIAVIAPMEIYMEQTCGPCVPDEQDLRLVIDGEDVELREKCVGYYLLDTAELSTGIYMVWIEMDFGETIHISDKMPLEIY